jgi:uncharacterized membrane protein
MPCDPQELRHVPLFALLDDDEIQVLAAQVEIKRFEPLQQIFKIGEPSAHGYILISGKAHVTTIDEDHQEVLVEEPEHGEFFGFASMLEQTEHQANAMAMEETTCVQIGRDDIAELLARRPMAGLDMMAMQARQIHASHQLVRSRAARNPNEVIEEETTFGERLADSVARFGGSWSFIILFAIVLVTYTMINEALRNKAWDPYPFILLNLFLSMLAAIQAPVIMMSQNRQSLKDRLRADQEFQINVQAEIAVQQLHRKIDELRGTMLQHLHSGETLRPS